MIFILLLIGALALLLNAMGTVTVANSPLHNSQKKRGYIALIWLVPIAGVLITFFLINRDIKRKQKQMNDETVPAIRELADRLNKLEERLHRRRPK